jgi:hypothetical protein
MISVMCIDSAPTFVPAATFGQLSQTTFFGDVSIVNRIDVAWFVRTNPSRERLFGTQWFQTSTRSIDVTPTV